MPKYRMLLVEELVESDSAEFSVDADTPETASAILIDAHARARDRDSNTVSLPDGQAHRIEPDNVVRSRVFCVPLDDEGNEVREISDDFPAGPAEEPTTEGAPA